MKHIRKRTWSILLALVMLFSLLPAMSLTAYAEVDNNHGKAKIIEVKPAGTGDNAYSLLAFVNFPYTVTGKDILNHYGYEWDADSIVIPSGNVVTISETNITFIHTGIGSITIKAAGHDDLSFDFRITGTARWKLTMDFAEEQRVNDLTYNSTSAQTMTFARATVPDDRYTDYFNYFIDSQKNSEGTAVSYFSNNPYKWNRGTDPTLTIAANTPAGTYTLVVRALALGNDQYWPSEYNNLYGRYEAQENVWVDSKKYSYNESKYSTITVTVNRAEPVAPTDVTGALGQTLADVELPEGWTWVDSSQSVGEIVSPAATFKANFAGDNNYLPGSDIDVPVTVDNAPQTITAEDVAATYGDTDKSVTASVTTPATGGGAISYTVKDGSGDYIDVASDGKLTIKKVPPTDGKAYVIVKAAATDDYAETTKEVTVSISKAEATVTAKDQSIMVGGTVPTLSGPDFYTVTGLVGEDTLTTNPTLAYQKDGNAVTPDKTTAGTYDIVASGASAGDNYTIKYTKGTLTISEKQPATVTKAPEAKTLTYTGSAQELVTAGKAIGGEMQYALGTETAATQPYTTSIPTETNAGTYYVWYKVAGDGNHADFEGEAIPVTIKAVYTVKFDTNGGNEIEDQTVVDGEKAAKPDDPEKTGNEFSGWYKDETFSDPFDFNKPITADVTVYAKWTPDDYNITGVTGVAGASEHVWTKGSSDDVVITVKVSEPDQSFDHFVGVEIDGVALERDKDYTVKEGSTIVTLKAATVQKLGVGKHNVDILFDNGIVSAELTVKAAEKAADKAADNTPKKAPNTGDDSAIALWMVVLLAGTAGAVLTLRRKKETK